MTTFQNKVTCPLRPAENITVQIATPGGLHRQMRIQAENANEYKPVRQNDVRADSHLLDWARMRIAQIHESSAGMERHRHDLIARGESQERLDQLRVWRESACFSEKEKAVLILAEAISMSFSRPVLSQLLEVTRGHFEREELVSLLLAIMAVNDWYFQPPESGMEKVPSSQPPETFEEQSICPHWQRIAHGLPHKVILPKKA